MYFNCEECEEFMYGTFEDCFKISFVLESLLGKNPVTIAILQTPFHHKLAQYH